ncbi:ABC transporter periplasmic subunit [Lacticaseibacillus thailandensis DSM 22698 = JCM 13996]|uniref:ABC transporter periplasmic subunit n=1 Tax=Lacticaseibacillus thailandensis DSM 22698 = JCM 13996 TaxID=1423810 RepID=A0A0R2C4M1_9LACO|nr:ABC transporter periplasmic subunit [Lacticaseibacillus thailandensis DSM 22698 = JCM 13996]
MATGTVVLASALVLAACGASSSTSSSKKQVLNLAASAQLDTIDISKSTGYGQTGNVYESFYRLGKNGKATAGLAKSASVSADGRTYTFKLRKAKFSNGDPITAQSFVYSWRRTINPKTTSPYSYLFAGIKNANDIIAGKKSPNTLGISAKGKDTVVVQLDQPIAYFKVLMAYPLFSPQDQKVVAKYGKKYGTKAQYSAYTGPFKISKWNGTSNKWTFVKNKDYWDAKKVKLQKINYMVVSDASTSLDLYQTGKIDLTQLEATQVNNYAHNKEYKIYPYSYVSFLEYNRADSDANKQKVLNNTHFRQAISALVNRKQLAKKVVGQGTVIPTGLVSTSLAASPKTGKDFSKDQAVAGTLDYNIKRAKADWAAAQKETGVKNISLTILAPSDDGDDKSSQQVVQYLKAQAAKYLPGLTLKIQSMPSQATRQNEQRGNFDIALAGWGADFNDPISFLQILQKDASYNYGKYDSAQYEALVKMASVTDANNPDKRWQDMIDASHVILKDQAVTPLYQSVYSFLKKDDVRGIIHNTAGTQWSYKYAYIK